MRKGRRVSGRPKTGLGLRTKIQSRYRGEEATLAGEWSGKREEGIDGKLTLEVHEPRLHAVAYTSAPLSLDAQ